MHHIHVAWILLRISMYALFYLDTLNTQVHEATKHTPYELVFGQPPRSLLVPNVTFKGKINEEELEEPNQEEEDDSIADDHRTVEQDDCHTAAEQDNHHTAELEIDAIAALSPVIPEDVTVRKRE